MATQLILDICGGEASEISVAGEIPAAPPAINFEPSLNERLTGLYLSDEQMEKILTDLGFGITKGENWTVSVPTWRRDAAEGADLVEDLARIHGFHNLDALSLPPLPGRREPTATLTQNRSRLARRALAGRGLSEAITWSFCLQAHAKIFGGGDDHMRLDNPISSDLDTMRPSSLVHLLLAGQRNADKGYPNSALFELGPVFRGTAPADQVLTLAGMRRTEIERHWTGPRSVDALTAKGDALAALAAMGANIDNLQLSQPSGDYWHPGRSGRLQMGPKNILADFGELHPRALKALGIEGRVIAFEVWPENLPAPRKKTASKSKAALSLSGLMPVHKDFAFIVPETVAAGDLIKAAKGADKQLITAVTLFDVYRGQGIDDGHKSLAIDVKRLAVFYVDDSCQLCKTHAKLTALSISDAPTNFNGHIKICGICEMEMLTIPLNCRYWRFLTAAISSEHPAVKVTAYHLLTALKRYRWAQDSLDKTVR